MQEDGTAKNREFYKSREGTGPNYFKVFSIEKFSNL